MRNAAHLECVQVSFHRLRINPCLTHPVLKQKRVVDALCSGQYFLAPHEEIIRVRERLQAQGIIQPWLVSIAPAVTYRVRGVRHGIEWAECERELINDEVIRLMFGLDDPPKTLLVFGTWPQISSSSGSKQKLDLLNVVQILPRDTVLDQELDGICEGQPKGLI